jgi:hypothetical protein
LPEAEGGVVHEKEAEEEHQQKVIEKEIAGMEEGFDFDVVREGDAEVAIVDAQGVIKVFAAGGGGSADVVAVAVVGGGADFGSVGVVVEGKGGGERAVVADAAVEVDERQAEAVGEEGEERGGNAVGVVGRREREEGAVDDLGVEVEAVDEGVGLVLALLMLLEDDDAGREEEEDEAEATGELPCVTLFHEADSLKRYP